MPWGVEVLHDQHHGLGVGVVHGEHLLDLVGTVDAGTSFEGLDSTPPSQGFDPHEDRAGPVTHVLAVLTQVTPRFGRDRVTDVVQELVGLLIHADHRPHRIMNPGVDREDVFHPGCELSVRLRRDRPARLQMRTQFRFFNTRPMVEWSRSGMSSTSTTCFSSNRSDHRAYPCGGAEQASAISRASTSPVTGEGTGGNSRCLRLIVAHTSPPLSANRIEINRTESRETPTLAPTLSRESFSPAQSSASSTRARLIVEAL